MNPNRTKRFQKLEALRGFAALYVVFFHALPQKLFFLGFNVGVLFRFGPEAVILFFILSGFVIKYSYERSTDKSFRYFFTNRFIRLYVPLVLIFALGYAIKCMKTGKLADPEVLQLLGNILMLQDVITQKPNVLCGVYMGNGPLWSLSYEWWFYMLFFMLTTRVEVGKQNRIVNVTAIAASVSYLFYPFFLNRFFMYFAIWWIGARFASAFLNDEKVSIRYFSSYLSVLVLIVVILAINLLLNRDIIHTYQFRYSAFPIIELRHFFFALIVTVIALIWKNLNWLGFNTLLGMFKYLAPCSYVIYISHAYLVVDAKYLHFINNKVVEFFLYILITIAFSFFVEVFFYNNIKRFLFRILLP